MSAHRFLSPLLGLILFGPPAAPQEAPPRVPRYDADVGLVRLSVTARDGKGALVHDLSAQDFQVLEDGVPQGIARFGHHEAPISVVVLFDKSASMADEKLMHAKDAVINFVRALGRDDEVLVVAFSDSIDALGDFGLDARTIEAATKRIRVRNTTRLYDAAVEAARAIAAGPRKEKRAILILSDGEDNASGAKLDEAAEALRFAGVPVYAIGIEMDDEQPVTQEANWQPRGLFEEPPAQREPLWKPLRRAPARKPAGPSAALEALARLTDRTGGWTYPVAAAKRCKEVCLRVAEELRNQYLLGYVPSNDARDGGWRTISVRTVRPGIAITTRAGYYATGER